MTTSEVTQLRGNGDKIWQCNRDSPKNFFLDLKRCALDPQKHDLALERAKVAKYEVLKGAKTRF